MSIGRTRPSFTPSLVSLESRVLLSATATDTFNNLDAWNQYSSTGSNSFRVQGGIGLDGSPGLITDGPSSTTARIWQKTPASADTDVKFSVRADSLEPVELIVRGRNLDTRIPTYYGLRIVRGVELELVRVVEGRVTPIALQKSQKYLDSGWFDVSFNVQGDTLSASVVRRDTGEYLGSSGAWQRGSASILSVRNSAISGDGFVGIGRVAKYAGPVRIDDFSTMNAGPVVAPGGSAPQPIPRNGPRHYTHIQVAGLAFGSTADPARDALLNSSVDLVIAGSRSVDARRSRQAIYTNLTNLSQDSLDDWNRWADARGISREEAFYHVARPTTWSGASPSSRPAERFANVQRSSGDGLGQYRYLTDAAASGAGAGDVPFGGGGESIVVGCEEAFREVNLVLGRGRLAGWSGVVEYAAGSNAGGTVWKTLPLLADPTLGLTRNGRLTFDPPADWKTATQAGSDAKLFYLRFRTLTGTASQAPVAVSILGRDFAAANGQAFGTIPAFDASADRNGDGYLNDGEYRTRAAGSDARFAYESRLFYPYYGPLRYVTNPASAPFRAWSADYLTRLLAASPEVQGAFLDNTNGLLPTDGAGVRESTANYTADLGRLLAGVRSAVAPKFLIANTVGGRAAADGVVANTSFSLEEAALRPLSYGWTGFLDLAELVKRRAAANPDGVQILDSLSAGGSPTDPRTQLATLAEYYLLADANRTMLMLYGGEEPSSSWTRHWFGAVATDVGAARGAYRTFATGRDPATPARSYNVYARDFGNALVLYKPLSYANGQGNGGIGGNTATAHALGGSYRLLDADGSRGPVVTSATLRNGEGAILMKV